MTNKPASPSYVPCRRFDQVGDSDPRLVATLSRSTELSALNLPNHLLSLYDHNDRLWATWRDAESRSLFSATLNQAWAESGGDHAPVHLLNLDEDIEFDLDELDSSDPN